MVEREMVRYSGSTDTASWLEGRSASRVIGVLAFVIMMSLGAHVRIPLPWTPVPITLQTFFVSLAGATLGPALGPASQAIYLLLGVAGLPVFAGGGSGVRYLLAGPTTGYLIGFVLASALVGWLVRRRQDPGVPWILLSMAAGSLTIYACGVAWLTWSLSLSLGGALAKGFLPFLVGDVVKTGAAVGLFRGYRRRVQNVFP
jgi:biotin transport system substrate-specific component